MPFRLLVCCGFYLSITTVLAAQPTAPAPSPQARKLIGATPQTFDATSVMKPLEISDIDLGKHDFSIGLSLKADDARSDLGDAISLWDGAKRTGFHLGLRNNTGCTSSQPNWRQLEFGIDANTEPQFRDEGRPGAAQLGFALCVHNGELFVATCEPGKDQAGKVYRYGGPGEWIDYGRLDGANSVTALASFGGHLYAGTGKYRLSGSALANSENEILGGRVYRLVSPGKWDLVGELAPTEAVAALVNFDGKLYASSLYAPAGFFRYESDGKWASLPTPNNKRVNALGVFQGGLYATSYDSGAVYRFDGTNWIDLGIVGDNTQTYSFAPFGGTWHVGTWPSGRVFRLSDKNTWIDSGRLGQELEVMAMLMHNGAYYAGTLPLGEIYRFDGGDHWTRLKQLDETPDVKFRRVWTMAAYQGRLFSTTLPSGKIWSMSTGGCVTYDRELESGWQTIVAERAGNRLRLYANNKLVAESAEFDAALALETNGTQLQIGNGPRGRFVGQLRDVWVDVGK